jgi:FG-GAP-like repeat/FG-GAP repeat/PASTA domain
VAISDLNSDGKPDVVTANGYPSDTVTVLLNRGDGSFQAKHDYRAGGVPEAVAIGDLNGDGNPDLVAANSCCLSSVSVLPNRGDGRFQAKLDFRAGVGLASIAIGDLNGDGMLDLATANLGGRYFASSVSVLINTPGLCTVQGVRGVTLLAAKRTIARASCRVGKIRRAFSKRVKKGRMVSQKPRFGAVLRGGGKVDLVVSRGSK